MIDEFEATIDGGRIMNGPYEGLRLLHLAVCMKDSAWDFPAFCYTLGLDRLFADECGEVTMYPTRDHARAIADAINLSDDAHRDEFVDNFPLEWST